MNRLRFLKCYAGYMTALAVFVIYMFFMWNYTDMDLLKIIVIYAVFLYMPCIAVPFLIMGGNEDDTE